MVIKKVHLRNFRNYEDRVFEFDPNITVITGPNGSGKTNILEAVYVLATGKSFRDNDPLLTRHGNDWWQVTGEIGGVAREVRFREGHKSYYMKENQYKRQPKQFAYPVVLFEPDHLQLIHGSPRSRRQFIDTTIAGLVPSYTTTLRTYERIIAQRNRLLKQPRVDADQLFIWDIQLAETAHLMFVQRQQVIDMWNTTLPEFYSHIAGNKTSIVVHYDSSAPAGTYKQSLIKRLHEHRERDTLLGTTSVGPHREDYSFDIDGSPFVSTGSRGEVRSLILAIVYANYEALRRHHNHQPLVLLDDVFSEFDEDRQKHLLSLFGDTPLIITGTGHDYSAISSQAERIDLG